MSDQYESFKKLSDEILSDIATGPARSTVLLRCDAAGRSDISFYVDDILTTVPRMAAKLEELAHYLRSIHERVLPQDASYRVVSRKRGEA